MLRSGPKFARKQLEPEEEEVEVEWTGFSSSSSSEDEDEDDAGQDNTNHEGAPHFVFLTLLLNVIQRVYTDRLTRGYRVLQT